MAVGGINKSTPPWKSGANQRVRHQIEPEWGRMSRLTREGTAEHVSRDQILGRERGQGKHRYSCSADHEQDWPPYPVDPYSPETAYYTDRKTGTAPMAVDVVDGHLSHGRQEEEEEKNPRVSTRFSLGLGNERVDAGRDGRTCLARPNSQA